MRCPSCGDTRRPRILLYLGRHRIVACRACMLARLDPMPTPAEAARLYDDAYFRDPACGYVDYAADEPVFRDVLRRRLRIVHRAGGRGRLLDIGCATGAGLLEARALGFAARGIEPAPETARRAAERSGCPVFAGTLEDALLAPASLDVITAFDVLEHLAEVGAALRRLRLALAPGGLLAVTVPDFGGLWARAAGRRWPFLTPWEHLVYFTRRTLRGALRTAGFEAVTFHPTATPLAFGTLATRLGLPAARVPGAWRHRGFGLPFGTLFALARAPGLREAGVGRPVGPVSLRSR